jgi:hypothetical protein
MTPKPLSIYFSLNRRYYRSVNLVRDLDKPDAVQGYVPTEAAAGALRRILPAFTNLSAHRAWTITGVYGTGKSAFAHYLTALCAGEGTAIKREALVIAQQAFAPDSAEFQAITHHIPPAGLLRVVATGQREPLSWTVARALVLTAQRFWRNQPTPDFWPQITDWEVELSSRKPEISNQEVLSLLKKMVQVAAAPLLLVVDELGKTLEYASHNQGVNDLYLLQQVAELELPGDHQVYFIGLLHQSFGGYSERLAAVEQSEWAKVQGRFEDIAFTESPSQMTRLIGQAIDRSQADPILCAIQTEAEAWFEALAPVLRENEVSGEVLAAAYPLHPIAALVLPLLCTRYAQNDRSLFTFLTSDEPYGLQEFLAKTTAQDDHIPTLKLYQLYDYFVESVTGLSSRINLQRWVEVQGLIEDARDRDPATLQILKTIGLLNLITTTGALRATPTLVALALCDSPRDKTLKQWKKLVQDLLKRSLVTYRKQADELRLWQGSDFNVEAAIYAYLEQARTPLADLMTQTYPLKPLVAQRHYATTGTLRYFEQRYGDSRLALEELICSSADYDGTILYWLDRVPFEADQATTHDGKPLIVVEIAQLDLLTTRARELQALQVIWQTAPELAQDGVARREVKQRLVEAERRLDETVRQTFDWANGENRSWVEGKPIAIPTARAFQAALSGVCDRAYPQTPVLDNELINRRVLTSQGAKARRELLEAMLEQGDQPRLGLEGYGPEVAMYYSVLGATGIHRQEEGLWGFYPPQEESGIWPLWEAIETFCLSAKQQQRSLGDLYRQLEHPPYGVKPGLVPVVFAAVLLYHVDDVGFYKDGTFIPVLGPEHFELLVKDPSRFSVKYFEMVGLRSHVFRELESILKSPNAKTPTGVRNASLLVVAKPLFNFVRKLPKYTLHTKRISEAAQQVIAVLQRAQEPDELLFVSLPQACGFKPITASVVQLCSLQEGDSSVAKAFRKQLVQALHEIQTAYEALLSHCKTRLYEAFGVRQEVNLREDLQVQAMPMVGKCIEPVLKRFILAAVDDKAADQEWLEALVMIVADKPPKAWMDEDITRFELALSDLVRRFKNLEALQKEANLPTEGFVAKRLTLTDANGQEIRQIIWIDKESEELLNRMVDRALAMVELKDNPKLQQAFIAKLSERVLETNVRDVLNELGTARKVGKTKKGGDLAL